MEILRAHVFLPAFLKERPVMSQYISFQKIRTDSHCMELTVTAKNPVITASSKIYVTEDMLMDLQEQISAFLSEPDLESYWENDVPGIGGPPCVTLRMLPQKNEAEALMEIYMELNDGGSFMEHHCRFYVDTDRKNLKLFADGIPGFCLGSDGCRLLLNPDN